MALQYAKSVFPRDHIPSKYVLLLAAGDSKEDIYTEATVYLHSGSVEMPPDAKRRRLDEENEKAFPDFPDMMDYIEKKGQSRMKSNQKYVTGNNQLPFNPAASIEILVYLRMCLAYSAGVKKPALESTVNMQLQAPQLAPYLKSLLETNTKPINSYIEFIRKLTQALGGSPAMYCLLEVVAVAPTALAPQFVKQLDWIEGLAFSSKEDMRELAAQIYAYVVVYGDSSKLTATLTKLSGNLKTQWLESQHGSTLVLGHIIGLVLRQQLQGKGESLSAELSKTMEEALLAIADLLDSTVTSPSGPSVLSHGACVALGEIGRSGSLPCPADNKLKLVEGLIKAVQTTKYPIKFRERASLCLGELCVGEAGFAHRQLIIEGLRECAGAQQLELHFTVGEALVMAALGTHSPEARDKWTTIPENHKSAHGGADDDLQVGSLLTDLLEKSSVSSNPHIKQASCVWLLAVVKECGHVAVVQEKLKDIQLTFMNLLSEPDELTQDISSKGLGLVYEKCGEEQKKELVAILVDTLTTGKRPPVNKVTSDTKVFEEGTIGKTPDGQNLSTYKELCSIANDLNQPDLIYKFMHLANHNAMWNSKKGAAFGFTTIAAQAGEQLAPYLSKIVPKMYRYQFDPNPKIQGAMTSIWNALVTNSKETVDKYMLEIMDDLLINLTSNQWRVRESSCLAVCEVVRGRPLDDAVDRLPALWQSAFRVRDDIKESVRLAADLTCKALSKATIKMCDVKQGKVGEAAIKVLLPSLLKDGLGSQVKEVRYISLTTIMKVSQNAGALLKPHIPVLVVALLESLSELEPQYLNYVALHVAGSQASQNKLDSARVAASKSSPMMEVINKCVQYVDKDVLEELVPRLRDVLKISVGLGTKVGCSNLIVSLSTHCPHDLSPHAGKLLGVLLSGMSDRNKTVRKSYASAIGHVVKISKDSSVEKLIVKLKESYFEKEDGSNDSCALVIHAMCQRAPDILKRHGALVLPLAFLAMHVDKEKQKQEGEDEKSNLWEEVWLESTPGTEAGLRMYLLEVVELTKGALSSSSWAQKAQGARAMKTIAVKLGAGGQLTAPHLGLLLSGLLSALPGRTWEGKESLLEAISSVCVSCKEALTQTVDGQPSMSEVMDALLPETQRDTLAYKMAALTCVADIIEKHELDYFAALSDHLMPLLKSNKYAEEEDVKKDNLLELEECIYLTLGRIWPSQQSTQDTYGEKLCEVLVANVGQSYWKVELAKLTALMHFFERLEALQKKELWAKKATLFRSQISKLVPVLCQALDSVKYSSIRRKAVNIIDLLLKRLNGLGEACSLCSEEGLISRLDKISLAGDIDLQEEAKVLSKQLKSSADNAGDTAMDISG